MTWREYMSQQDYVGKRCEQFIGLVQSMNMPAGMSRGACSDFKTHQAIMFGYRLAIAEIQQNINSIKM